jgi:enoyl-CoA hydratase/carnithine racemase
MDRCGFPIIGAINGWAINAGFEIALACDILLASPPATFMDTHIKFGLQPAWGMSQVNKALNVFMNPPPVLLVNGKCCLSLIGPCSLNVH